MTRSVVVLFLVLVQTTLFQTHALYTCGTIGNSNENRVITRRDKMFYLNTANPAPCTGNITSWRVCYYQSRSVDQSRLRAHWATYAVYRKLGSGAAEQYERVSGVYRALRVTGALLNRLRNSTILQLVDGVVQDGFTCYSDRIDVGESPVIVQAGDVLGACIFLEPGRVLQRQLDIVGEVNGESLLTMDSNAAGCNIGRLPSIVPASQLSIIRDRKLHLYANIETNLVPCKAALNAVNISFQQSYIENGRLYISQAISSSTLSISQAISSSTLSISQAISSSTLSISQMMSSSTLLISQMMSSSTLSISQMMSSSTLSVSPTISSSTLSISPTISSSTLSISLMISSSTLSISPIISSSVLRLCYATYPKTTSTTHPTKFAQSTPTSSLPNQDMIGSDKLAGIVAGTVVGALLLLVSLVLITLFLCRKKLKKKQEKTSFNLTHNPAYTEEGTDDSTQFNSFNVTANVSAAYNVHSVRYLQALERSHYGHRELQLQSLTLRGYALNMNQNFADIPPGLGVSPASPGLGALPSPPGLGALPSPPGLGVIPAAIEELQDPDMEEDNHYESIT